MSPTSRSMSVVRSYLPLFLAVCFAVVQIVVYSDLQGSTWKLDPTRNLAQQNALPEPMIESPAIPEPVAVAVAPPKITPQCVKKNLLQKSWRSLTLYDKATQVAVLGMPKGGATIATQLMFRHMNLTEEANKYSSWIHDYRMKVFPKMSETLRCQKHCYFRNSTVPDPDREKAVCIKIVRSPLDRIVSSYIHVMRSTPKRLPFRELDALLERVPLEPGDLDVGETFHRTRATFAQFVQALHIRSTDPVRREEHSSGETHFTSQSSKDHCDRFSELIPLEALQDSLEALNGYYGIAMDSTGFTSSHYIVQDKAPAKIASDATEAPNLTTTTPFRKLETKSPEGKAKLPSYDKFFHDPQLNAVICQLLCEDYRLYARACANSLLEGRTETARVCEAERERVRSICTMSPIF